MIKRFYFILYIIKFFQYSQHNFAEHLDARAMEQRSCQTFGGSYSLLSTTTMAHFPKHLPPLPLYPLASLAHLEFLSTQSDVSP